MKKIVCTAVPALIAGIAIGFAGAKLLQNDEPTPQLEVKTEKKNVKKNSENPRVNRSRFPRREFQRQMPEESSANHEVAVEENSENSRRENRNLNIRDRIERMRTENPEEYAAHTNRLARWRDSRRQRAVSKLDFLASVDTSTMSKPERETHEKLQNLIEEREELQTRIEEGFASGEMSDEDRRAVWDQMRDADRQIAELNRAERENLIKKTAEAVGLTGEEVGEVAGTIMKVIEATENNSWGRGGRAGRGGRGGRGGRR
jgi:hypothetical protein